MNIFCNIARSERSALNLRVKLGGLPLIVVKTTYAGETGFFFATHYRGGLGLISKNVAGTRDAARGPVALARYGRRAKPASELERATKKTAKVVVLAEAA